MLEWNVHKHGDTEQEPGKAQPRRLWWRVLGILFVLALAGAAWVWREARLQEARLLTALEQTARDEERALRFGVQEQATEFADPASSPAWRFCYEMTYRATTPDLPEPVLSVTERDGEYATILLDYGEYRGRQEVTTRRYRMGQRERWYRTESSPAGEESTATLDHFLVPALPASVDLSLDLEALREYIMTRWPTNTCEECLLTLTVLPHPRTPSLYGVNAQRLCLNEPAHSTIAEKLPLSADEQYTLTLVTGIIRGLTMPVWLPEYPPVRPPSDEKILAEGTEGEWLALLLMLQEAQARHWLLPEVQRKAIRNAWREELAGEWRSPFDGPLPFYPDVAPEDARRRWLIVNLLIERAVEHGGDELTLGRLASTLLAYRPSAFDAQRFFTALVGGSLADLETLSRQYVLTPEE